MNTLVKIVNILESDLRYCERCSNPTPEKINDWYSQAHGMVRAAILFLKSENRRLAAVYLLNYCHRNIWPRYEKLLDKAKKI